MNLTTATNRGSFTSHQMNLCQTSMIDTETGQSNFQAETPLGTRRPWTKERFQLSNILPSAIHWSQRDCQKAWNDEQRERSPERVKHYDWPVVFGWPFWPKHQPFRYQCLAWQGIQQEKFQTGVKITKKTEFSELRKCVQNGSQGQGISSQNKLRNYHCCGTK